MDGSLIKIVLTITFTIIFIGVAYWTKSKHKQPVESILEEVDILVKFGRMQQAKKMLDDNLKIHPTESRLINKQHEINHSSSK